MNQWTQRWYYRFPETDMFFDTDDHGHAICVRQPEPNHRLRMQPELYEMVLPHLDPSLRLRRCGVDRWQDWLLCLVESVP